MGNCAAALLAAAVILTAVDADLREGYPDAFRSLREFHRVCLGIYADLFSGNDLVEISLGLNNFINAQGYTLTGMLSVVIGAGRAISEWIRS